MDFQVLIVDDNQINLTLFKQLVARVANAKPTCFDVPMAALGWCAEHVPDVLIVDYMMPEMDGIELIQRFRTLPGCEEVPVVMITANDDMTVRYKALETGANDFLTKPVDKSEFIARVRNMCALRRGQRLLRDRAALLAEEVAAATATIVARERETIFCLARAAEYRDPETGAHILRMAHYSRLIAARLGLPEDLQDLIFQSAPMHDIGKVGIPDYILLKPGKLTDEEFAVMKGHTTIGHQILIGSTSTILGMAAEIALHHHEKFDGSGYPGGLAGEAIPLTGRIVAVADVFDALTSERPYKKAWAVEDALNLLKEQRGRHFDPDCVDAFLCELDQVKAIRAEYFDEPVPA
jgi:putative two-component system response regulator